MSHPGRGISVSSWGSRAAQQSWLIVADWVRWISATAPNRKTSTTADQPAEHTDSGGFQLPGRARHQGGLGSCVGAGARGAAARSCGQQIGTLAVETVRTVLRD